MTPKAAMVERPYQFSLFEQETVTVQWVADLLKCSESSVKRRIEEGKLRGYQFCYGGEWHILKSSVVDYERQLMAAWLV